MAKITHKLQVTIPKSLAERRGLKPGDDIQWQERGEAILILPAAQSDCVPTIEARLATFDAATRRQRDRDRAHPRRRPARRRGWSREELYRRGKPD